MLVGLAPKELLGPPRSIMFRLFLVIAGSFAAGFAHAAEIVVRDEAAPVGSLVRLGDVADIRGVTANEIARIAALPLMPAPAPGAQQYLSAGSIREMLAAQGEAPSDHRFSGAYRVRVGQPSERTPLASEPSPVGWQAATPARRRPRSTGFRTPPGVRPTTVRRSVPDRRGPGLQDFRRVDETLRNAIQAKLNESSGEPLLVRTVEASRLAVDVLRSFDASNLIVSLPAAEAGRLAVNVRPASRDESESFRVIAEVIPQPFRVVAVAPLRRGSFVTASSVRIEPVPLAEIDGARTTGYASLEQAVGQEATRPIRAGEPLSDLNCAGPMLVRRGEDVSVISGGGGVTVRLRAVAQGDGRRGDLTPVETEAGDRFNARVIGARRLAVLSAGSALSGVTRSGDLR